MNQDFSNFSLIFPDAESHQRHYNGNDRPDINMFALEELGLLEVFSLKNSDLDEYFTTNAEVIKYRA